MIENNRDYNRAELAKELDAPIENLLTAIGNLRPWVDKQMIADVAKFVSNKALRLIGEYGVTHMPANYKGQKICPRCGSGWPNCATRDPSGVRFSHEETCEIYQYTLDICMECHDEKGRK